MAYKIDRAEFDHGAVELTVSRDGGSEDIYRDGILYEWTVLEGDWRKWDASWDCVPAWDPMRADWQEETGCVWDRNRADTKLRHKVIQKYRGKLLGFRLRPRTEGEGRIQWVWTGSQKTVYCRKEENRNGEVLLYLRAESPVDAQLLYLKRTERTDPLRYPLPFDSIGDAESCVLASGFGEFELCLDETDPHHLAIRVQKEEGRGARPRRR